MVDPTAAPDPNDEHLARFFQAAATDPDLTRLLLEVINLKQPYTRLTDPDIVDRLSHEA